MPFDFPNSPTTNQTVVAPNGATFVWDGVKWTTGTGPTPGLFLPLAGGTMQGPLNYTATGGTAMRSAQDRAAEVANVLDFGADPGNGIDSTPAFNLAASQTNASGRRKAVYVPTGSYNIQGQILLSGGQTLYGDGRGSSVLIIDGRFAQSATSLIRIQTSNQDPGPTIRDLQILFVQPLSSVGTTSQRANYKTLAAGGTVATGIQYPWAISCDAGAGRIWLQNLRIAGAWNGITTNGNNAVYWIDNLELGALNVGMSLGEGTQMLDYSKYSNIEFWNFGLEPYTYMDGGTTAMRIGGVNGLVAHGLSCFTAKIIFTAEANNCWADITNLGLDGDGATVEVNSVIWLHIANLYSSCSAVGVGRPAVNILGGIAVNITNWHSSNQSAQPHLNVAGGSDTNVSVTGGEMLCFNTTVSAVQVSSGSLRMSNMKIKGAAGTAFTQPLINQGSSGVLQVDNLDISSNAGGSGNGVQMNTDNVGNYLGAVALGSGWHNVSPFGLNGRYGDVFRAPLDNGSIQSGSYSFGTFTAGGHNSTAYGVNALGLHQDGGNNNTAMGTIAGYGITTGKFNCFFGSASGYSPAGITGGDNVGVGANAAYNLTTGAHNTLIGSGAGYSLTTGSGNIAIAADVPAAASNTLNIGGVLTATGIDTPATSITTVAGALGPTRIALNPITTSAHLNLNVANNNLTAGVESKLRFSGSFPSGGDFGNYLAASLRAGWTAFSWASAYLNVWLTNVGNGSSDDASMVQVAGFTASSVSFGTASAAVDVKVIGPSGTQKNYYLYRGANIAWSVASRDATDDFAILRFNDSGGFVNNSFIISRANGRVSLPEMPASTSYASDAAASAGGVAVGQLYRNGSVVQVRVA